MLRLLDIFFFAFHTSLIAFVLFGWAWRKTRRAHLIVSGLTLFSWVGLGIWYGFGYCPCTDWHWHVREQLGETNLPNSYIKYLLDAVTGWNWNPTFVDVLTAGAFVLACCASLWVNFAGRFLRRLK